MFQLALTFCDLNMADIRYSQLSNTRLMYGIVSYVIQG